MKFDEKKIDIICKLYSEGKGIVEISKITKTFSNNVRKIIVNKFGELPKKCKMDISSFEKKIQLKFPHLKVLSYTNINDKSIFYCTKHDFKFELFCKSVLNGTNCSKCKEEIKKNKNIESANKKIKERGFDFNHFLRLAKEKFGNKFQYLNYKTYKKDFQVICPEHGIQIQTPVAHLQYIHGCGECAKNKKKLTHEEFLLRANKVHNFKYSYLNEYKDGDTIMNVNCPKHGVFQIKSRVHINNKGGCQKCSAFTSRQETYVKDLLSAYKLKVEQHNKKLLKGVEIDILVNEKIGFEINGLLFHREGLVNMKMNPTNNNKNRHLIKTELANQHGVKLYQIFEDELLLKEEIVKHKILNACGVNQAVKSNGRDCKLSEISFNESKNFLNKFHIQGGDISKIRVGGYLNTSLESNELVGVMTFKDKGDGNYELNRYATHFDYHVRGLASKMLKWFVRQYKPTKITTFADIRWTPDGQNNLYTTLGFKLVEKQPPVYHYYNPKMGTQRFNRMQFQKHRILEKYANEGLDGELSEKELMASLGYDRIWDCGNWKYEIIF